MKHRFRTVWRGLVATLVVVAVVPGVAASAQAAAGAAARLSVRSSEYGKTLFGPSGKVVYVFSADRSSTSRCYGDCAKAWPPLLTTGAPLAGPGVVAWLLGTTKRTDAAWQVIPALAAPLLRMTCAWTPGDPPSYELGSRGKRADGALSPSRQRGRVEQSKSHRPRDLISAPGRYISSAQKRAPAKPLYKD